MTTVHDLLAGFGIGALVGSAYLIVAVHRYLREARRAAKR